MVWRGALSIRSILSRANAIHLVPHLMHPSSMTSLPASQQSLQDEIADLERRLRDVKAQLNQHQGVSSPSPLDDGAGPSSLAAAAPTL